MAARKLICAWLLAALLAFSGFESVQAHGKLMDPVSRSSAWRKGFKTPPNYTDNELSCGGVGIQHGTNGGKCGPCGDNYQNPRPRANENGGTYGTGTIVAKYQKGARITALVNLSANHIGYFEFSVCPLASASAIETEECFVPLKLANGDSRYPLPVGKNGDYKIDLQLPPNITCERCTFRWHYQTGNSWGICPDGKGKLGCGPQEQFRGCADVSISN